ncbi:DUF5689 domain-containing protein [Portibacter lacus]|uniref:DUF5689 domain-containing protein n=1 Tax=Portibacter lacus TaxID=1099794 RepID=A0AA37SLZ2_9BACT|nr:DUF5689 domain-containing protein [Portibacter lacus]GLR15444.1 hypothetical protein GCM10007940_00590 [Portibacter lacus]
MKKVIYLLAIVFLASCVDHMFDEPPGFVPEVVESNAMISDLLDQWVPESFTEITDELTFEGQVVANDESGNFYKQLVLQDETGGIQVRLDAIGLFNEFPLGRTVTVKCQGLYISDYNGLPQLSAVQGEAGDLSSIAIPEPLIPEYVFNSTTTEDVPANVVTIPGTQRSMVNTFVKYDNVQFTLGSTNKTLADAVNQFSVNLDVEDCSENQILVRTSGFASFASSVSPNGKGSIQGILSVFRDDYQLLLRDFSDINMEGSRCDGEEPIDTTNMNTGDPVDEVVEDFEKQVDNQDISIEEWLNVAVKGDRKWRAKEFDGNVYAQATAYNDSNPEMEAWLITPKIKFDAPMKLELRTAIAFHVHNGLTVWYSTNFDGSDVNGAEWNSLELKIAGSGAANYAWVDSGEVDLSAITGEAYIGFKYEGNATNGTTSFIIDDVKIVDK